jgi:hypothetical protein
MTLVLQHWKQFVTLLQNWAIAQVFDIKDLLIKKDSGLIDDKQVLFTAKNILTNNPLTINDYRKLLIDINGVHNAWLIADDKRLNESGTTLPVNESVRLC